jgi:Fur family peroxide stress response transcriptional regulator
MKTKDAYNRLVDCNIHPSVQRLAIMKYLMTHFDHPTVEDVYLGLCHQIHTLSKTTVYNTLRLFSEHNAALMLTIDEHRVCYDGNTQPHVHFYCKECGKIIDMFDQSAPMTKNEINGNVITEAQLYYKGICSECRNKNNN